MFDLENPTELAKQLDDVIPKIRNRRQPLIEKYIKAHDAWKNNNVDANIVSETFHHKIPSLRRAVERFSVRGAQMVLPTNEYFEVYPLDEDDNKAGKKAEAVLTYLLYMFRKKVKTYSLVKQLFRTYLLYQRAIAKTGVRLSSENGKQVVWPTVRAVDPFLWFFWPETSNSLDEAQIVVEDSFVPWDQYQLEVANGRAEDLVKSKLMEPTWPDDITRRLSTEFFTEPTSSTSVSVDEQRKKATTDWVFRSEVWVRYERGWRFVWIVWNYEGGPKVVRVSKKTYARPSYRVSIAREIPSEQYTSSMSDDLVALSTVINDEMNMFLEGLAMSSAGPVAVDPNTANRSSIVFKPRSKWLVPPDNVRAIEWKDTSKTALQGLAMTNGILDQYSGTTPLSEGQPIRNMPRAGFAVSSLMSMALSDIRDVARSIEEDILTLILSDFYQLTMEFVPASQIIRIPRTYEFAGRQFYKKDIEGDYEFNWVGSLQGQDYQTRATRMLEFMKQISPFSQQIAMDLQAKNKQINWTAILKRLWRYGLGEYGADTIIEDIPEGQMNPTTAMGMLEKLNMERTSPMRGTQMPFMTTTEEG